jgi:hypothetical protein
MPTININNILRAIGLRNNVAVTAKTDNDTGLSYLKGILDLLGIPIRYTGTFTTSDATNPADAVNGATYGANKWIGSYLVPVSGTEIYECRQINAFSLAGVFGLVDSFRAAPGLVSYSIIPSFLDPRLATILAAVSPSLVTQAALTSASSVTGGTFASLSATTINLVGALVYPQTGVAAGDYRTVRTQNTVTGALTWDAMAHDPGLVTCSFIPKDETTQLAIKAKTDLIKVPVYENITYSPSIQNTGDLEGATKTIHATAEAVGLGSADYSAPLTLPMGCTVNGVAKVLGVTETRLIIKRIAARLAVTIDSDDGTHDLKYRVYVDAQDANHMLFDVTCTTTGSQINVNDCLVGTREVVFNLLKDNAAHTFYFYFWSPGDHHPVISVVQLWEGVGTTAITWASSLHLNYQGLVSFNTNWTKIGAAGAGYLGYWLSEWITAGGSGIATSGATYNGIVGYNLYFGFMAVATDLVYLNSISLNLRSDT